MNGNNKQRFFLEIYVNDDWFANRDVVPWQVFIGCTQGHTTKVVDPSSISHRLSAVGLDCLGWIFHVTDARNVDSIKRDGLRRYGRDSLHFMYDNDGAIGYIRKGAGTVPPRHYDGARYCVLNVHCLLMEGYELYLTQNGVVLIYEDLHARAFTIVDQFPYLGYNCFRMTSGHGLPPEVRAGKWRPEMNALDQYREYLSPDEISLYIERDELVEFRVPRSISGEKTNSMGIHGSRHT